MSLDRREAERLAEIHAEAFDRPWAVGAFERLLADGRVRVAADASGGGFILWRTVADEAEVLTLAVREDRRREGIGGKLLDAALSGAGAAGARRLFLEVAEDNGPARALYEGRGFVEVGRRRRYYQRSSGFADALVLSREAPDGPQGADRTRAATE